LSRLLIDEAASLTRCVVPCNADRTGPRLRSSPQRDQW